MAAAPLADPLADPGRAPWLEVSQGYAADRLGLFVTGPYGGALLGDAVLRLDGVDHELGPLFVPGERVAVPIGGLTITAASRIELLIRPRPELGVELFAPVPVYAKPVTIRPP